MARQLLNTLFVQTPHAWVHLDHDTIRVKVEEKCLLQVPLLHLNAIVIFNDSMISPAAMGKCAEMGVDVTFLDFAGRFRCRVAGPVSGNVLLRKAQYQATIDSDKTLEIARHVVAGKIRNARKLLQRGSREAKNDDVKNAINLAVDGLANSMKMLETANSVERIRGIEGESSARYFDVYGKMITVPTTDFSFTTRSRRPPKDRVNAIMSFLYALLTRDCVSACESVGLDPQFGYLHVLRPGRPSLALDLMEEFRAPVADKITLTLINRKQLQANHFIVREDAGDSVLLNEDGRKILLTEYQQFKQHAVKHTLLKEDIPFGLIPDLQARLLSRYLRGDVPHYTPWQYTG